MKNNEFTFIGISFTLKLIFGVKVPILPAADTLPSTYFFAQNLVSSVKVPILSAAEIPPSTFFFCQILVFGVKVPILPAAKNPFFNLFLLSKPCLWCQSAYFACC